MTMILTEVGTKAILAMQYHEYGYSSHAATRDAYMSAAHLLHGKADRRVFVRLAKEAHRSAMYHLKFLRTV